jgi:arginase
MARGPQALLAHGFAEALAETGHAVAGPTVLDAGSATERTERVIRVARATARATARSSSRGRLPLILSGGCLYGVGVAQALQRMARSFGALWVDAHGDFNTPETTPSGYWDGMALATLCGRSLPEVYKAIELAPVPFSQVVHLGGRALDPPEVEDFARLQVLAVPPAEVAREARRSQICAHLARQPHLYLHVDLDGIDPAASPAVHFPVAEGIVLDDLLDCFDALPRPLAITLAGLDFDRATDEQAERQTSTCVELVRHLLERP